MLIREMQTVNTKISTTLSDLYATGYGVAFYYEEGDVENTFVITGIDYAPEVVALFDLATNVMSITPYYHTYTNLNI